MVDVGVVRRSGLSMPLLGGLVLLAARERSTIVLFARRLSTVKAADHAVVIRDGRVVETGTPDILLRRRGEFYHLSASQLQEERG
jgi:ABC-type multidrug transport system fused ATPase/permease subunit